jgi:hypothetical protein
MLEPCEVKVSRTVLRGERCRKASDLPDRQVPNNLGGGIERTNET